MTPGLVTLLRGQLLATLATTSRNNRTAGAGAHASTEAVNTCTTTVVRLERPLALCHVKTLLKFCLSGHRTHRYDGPPLRTQPW